MSSVGFVNFIDRLVAFVDNSQCASDVLLTIQEICLNLKVASLIGGSEIRSQFTAKWDAELQKIFSALQVEAAVDPTNAVHTHTHTHTYKQGSTRTCMKDNSLTLMSYYSIEHLF